MSTNIPLMGGVKFLISKINYLIKTRTNEGKCNYLRGLGVKIGKGTRFSGNLAQVGSEPYLIEIGDNNLISSDVTFHTHDGGVKVLNTLGFFPQRMDKMARVKIGSNCFLGAGARIMMGVTVGDNVIIGAGSIVSKDIPNNSVAAGVPARVICTIEEYYQRNQIRSVFYPTPGMSADSKRKYLEENVPLI